MKRDFPRLLQLPEEGRPNWFAQDGPELLYLGWGERAYGQHPIPVARHTGWSYLVILSGRPRLVLAEREIVLRMGDLFIMHPDCASGWSDTAGGRSSVLSWNWKTAPGEGLEAGDDSPRLGRADRATLRRLRQLHVHCRMEVASPDEFTPAALAALHGSVNVEFARAFGRKPKRPERRLQLELAWQWLRRNLHVARPVEHLCAYLEVSPATLHRLFVGATGHSPADAFHRLRMESAHHQLREGGAAVKEVAYSLGYRHPNDFSRAFTRYFKRTPSQVRHSSVSR